MPYDLNLNFTRTRIADPRIDVTRASKKTDAGGWDFTNGGTVGTLTEYVSNAAAIHATAGVSVEEASTNQIRNPRCEGAVAGTPGTNPTNWSVGAAGITKTIVGSGTEKGCPYVDVRWAGTPTGDPYISFEGQAQIAATTGESWTFAVGCRIVGGDMTNISGLRLQVRENTGAGVFVSAQTSGLKTPTSEHKRFYYPVTLAGGGTVGTVVPWLLVVYDGSGAIDITLRIYAPQLEEKPYPTSPIFPTAASPAASTRAADIVSANFGSWGSEVASSIYCEFVSSIEDTSGVRRVWSIDDGTNNNRLHAYINSALEPVLFAAVGGVSSVNSAFISNPISTGDVVKLSAAFSANDFAASRNGATQVTDSSVTMPTGLTTLRLGNWSSGTSQLNGYIRDFRYWPRRLTNAELEALAGN